MGEKTMNGCHGELRVAYIGAGSGTSRQRAKALERLGLHVTCFDPWDWLGRNMFVRHIHLKTGYFLAGALVARRLFSEVAASRPDVIWVNQGELLGRGALNRLRSLGVPIVNYANDNPFSSECHRRFTQYRRTLDLYDLVVVVFAEAVPLTRACGARRVIRRHISADESAHLGQGVLPRKKTCDVTFIGTWHPDGRGALIAEIIRQGVPLNLWGDRWDHDHQWATIKTAWRGPGIYDELQYATVIGESRICLGLVNHVAGNQHTDRSTEIPAIGSLLCAERTGEHEAMYDDGEEAIFWTTPAECARLCRRLLENEPKRAAIAAAGRRRAIRNGYFNEQVLGGILAELGFAVRAADQPSIP
ncbi:MAG: glycosyltransferase [Planctomycetes bacterium]|nr:glycosyltransferase [Planctomycetota bacterium]